MQSAREISSWSIISIMTSARRITGDQPELITQVCCYSLSYFFNSNVRLENMSWKPLPSLWHHKMMSEIVCWKCEEFQDFIKLSSSKVIFVSRTSVGSVGGKGKEWDSLFLHSCISMTKKNPRLVIIISVRRKLADCSSVSMRWSRCLM